MKKVFAALSAVVLLLLISSCGETNTRQSDSDLKNDDHEYSDDVECITAFDCFEGYVCVDGKCVEDSGDTGNTGNTGNSGNTGDSGNTGNTGDSGNSGDINCTDESCSVPAGLFMMGCNKSVDDECNNDEYPYHEVILSAYKIDKYEVTVSQYKKCVNAGVCNNNESDKLHYEEAEEECYEEPVVFKDGETVIKVKCLCNFGIEERLNYPMNCVSWYGAKAYCDWIGKRLPTEAEWEKAARGADGRKYPWGNVEPDSSYIGWDDEKEEFKIRPVGSYEKGMSPYGLFDMAGNVAEWVNDWYEEGYYSTSPKENPKGPDEGDQKVLRGLVDSPDEVRASVRDAHSPNSVGSDEQSSMGFRCVNCIKDERRIIECEADNKKLQEQICNSEQNWIDLGNCFDCVEGDSRVIDCIEDVEKLQNQKCSSENKWVNEGECYDGCSEYEERTVVCKADSSKKQKQICNSEHNWIDEGSCFDDCDPEDEQTITCPTDTEKKQKQVCDISRNWIDDGECVYCFENQTRSITCLSDGEKWQKQVCNENGEWVDEGECEICAENDKRAIECETDNKKWQKQVCNSIGQWINDGICYGPYGSSLEINVTVDYIVTNESSITYDMVSLNPFISGHFGLTGEIPPEITVDPKIYHFGQLDSYSNFSVTQHSLSGSDKKNPQAMIMISTENVVSGSAKVGLANDDEIFLSVFDVNGSGVQCYHGFGVGTVNIGDSNLTPGVDGKVTIAGYIDLWHPTEYQGMGDISGSLGSINICPKL